VLRPELGGFHRFISDLVYEGRLNSDEGAAQQCIIGKTYPMRTGAHLIEVPHAGNTQSSQEEIAAIRIELQRLLGCKFRDRAGHERKLSLEDVLIVALIIFRSTRSKRPCHQVRGLEPSISFKAKKLPFA
jgi:hypothetical protein